MPSKFPGLNIFWWATFVAYLIALVLTSIAGPYWALWLWSVLAFPQFLTVARDATGWARSAGLWIVAWILVAVAVPGSLMRYDTVVSRWRYAGPAVVVITVAWPVIISIARHSYMRALDATNG